MPIIMLFSLKNLIAWDTLIDLKVLEVDLPLMPVELTTVSKA